MFQTSEWAAVVLLHHLAASLYASNPAQFDVIDISLPVHFITQGSYVFNANAHTEHVLVLMLHINGVLLVGTWGGFYCEVATGNTMYLPTL